MGERMPSTAQRLGVARRGLRERAIPAIAAALALRVSVATAQPRYDLRALGAGLGLLVLLALAIVAAALDALAISAVSAARQAAHEAARVRVRFGPATAAVGAPPAPIGEDLLLDKRGRPLRGAARAARIAAIERERATRVPFPVAPPFRVIELPDPRAHPAARRALALAAIAYARSRPFVAVAYRWSLRAAGSIRALPFPSVPVPTLPLRWVRIVAITTTMTFVFATAIGTTGFIAQQGRVALGASTTLSIISGEVSVRTPDAGEFRPAADGELLRAGMTIRTSADTYAVLTYFEGSTVSLEPGTTLVIDTLGADPDGTTVIAMTQQLGRTWHSVTKLIHQGSKYEVRTPTATATVRGTMFSVGVEFDEQGELVSTVETAEGAVATAKAPTPAEPQPQEVVVQSGFQVTVKQSAPIEQPKPAPEPERKVTVTVGAAAGLVLDPVGRANGIKDGRVVVQTPGAKVEERAGRLEVTLPNVKDGKVATVIDPKVAPQAAVEVVTTVVERGDRGPLEQRTEQRVAAAPAAAPAVAAIEVKKGASVEVVRVSDEEKEDIASSVKVAEAPKVVTASVTEQRKGDESKKDEKREGPGGPGGSGGGSGPSGFVPANSIPPLPAPAGDQAGPQMVAKRTEAAKEADRRTASVSSGREEKREAAKPEAPRVELPKIELPRIGPSKIEPATGAAPAKSGEATSERSKAEPPKGVPARKNEAEKDEKAKAEPRKAEAPRLELPKIELPKIELPRIVPAGESAPKTEPAKNEAPKQEAPKVEAPRVEAPKVDQPQPEAPKQEAPKQEGPKPEAPKRDAQKEKSPSASVEGSRFVPTQIELPPLPFGSDASAGKKEDQTQKKAGDGASGKKEDASPNEQPKAEPPKEQPRIELPKIELPKIELPFFRQDEPRKDSEKNTPALPRNGKDDKDSRDKR